MRGEVTRQDFYSLIGGSGNSLAAASGNRDRHGRRTITRGTGIRHVSANGTSRANNL